MKKYTDKINNISNQDRVIIGEEFVKLSLLRVCLGVPLIYIPLIITVPFAIFGACLVKLHLQSLGAKNLKKYKDFLPKKDSHRYASVKEQIAMKYKSKFKIWVHSKLFWFYNCGIYCPYSVALFVYLAYLVRVVENWWCPFYHEKKSKYADAAIDKSYWHIGKDINQLHPDDADCIIWNSEAKTNKKQEEQQQY